MPWVKWTVARLKRYSEPIVRDSIRGSSAVRTTGLPSHGWTEHCSTAICQGHRRKARVRDLPKVASRVINRLGARERKKGSKTKSSSPPTRYSSFWQLEKHFLQFSLFVFIRHSDSGELVRSNPNGLAVDLPPTTRATTVHPGAEPRSRRPINCRTSARGIKKFFWRERCRLSYRFHFFIDAPYARMEPHCGRKSSLQREIRHGYRRL